MLKDSYSTPDYCHFSKIPEIYVNKIPVKILSNARKGATKMQHGDIMDQNWERHRTHQRVFFSHKAGLTAMLALPGIRNAIPAKIMDISLGGMGCIMKRHKNLVFHENDLLIMAEFYNLDRKRIAANLSLEIRWVLDVKNFENIGLGFRFIDPADEIKQQLSIFIDQGLNAQNLKIQKADSLAFIKKQIQI